MNAEKADNETADLKYAFRPIDTAYCLEKYWQHNFTLESLGSIPL